MEFFAGLSAGMLLRFQFGWYTLIDIDVLEIRSNLNKFEKTIAEPSTANTRKVFFRVEPLAPPTEKRPHENSG